MKKIQWGIIIILISLIIVDRWDDKKTNQMLTILENTSSIDSISIKEGRTKKELFILEPSSPSFKNAVNVYENPYRPLTFFERKVLKQEPIATLDYFSADELIYQLSVYPFDPEHFPNIDLTTASDSTEKTYHYIYYPEDEELGYIFALKELNQLIGVNDGLKEIVDHGMVKSIDEE